VIVVFTIEVVLKIWAFGPRAFFSSTENSIDALVVGAAFMSLMVYGCAGPESSIHRTKQLANLGLLFLTFRGVRLFPKCDIFAKFQCAFTVSGTWSRWYFHLPCASLKTTTSSYVINQEPSQLLGVLHVHQ
jgi:hypothetical protein